VPMSPQSGAMKHEDTQLGRAGHKLSAPSQTWRCGVTRNGPGHIQSYEYRRSLLYMTEVTFNFALKRRAFTLRTVLTSHTPPDKWVRHPSLQTQSPLTTSSCFLLLLLVLLHMRITMDSKGTSFDFVINVKNVA
jgi:hypothetical protein